MSPRDPYDTRRKVIPPKVKKILVKDKDGQMREKDIVLPSPLDVRYGGYWDARKNKMGKKDPIEFEEVRVWATGPDGKKFATMVPAKVCSNCRRDEKLKPLSEFPKSNQSADGYFPWCRDCRNAYMRRRRKRLRAKGLKSERRHAPREAFEAWRQRDPEGFAEIQRRNAARGPERLQKRRLALSTKRQAVLERQIARIWFKINKLEDLEGVRRQMRRLKQSFGVKSWADLGRRTK